jgi:gluconate 2-dehydrogenase gamma chain
MSKVPTRITRRRFLEYSVYSAVGGYFVLTYGACRRTSAKRSDEPRLAFLTPAEMITTTAACERILPHDEDPGAIDLGVPAYIDRALATERRRRWGERFRRGLVALDEESNRRQHKPFHRLAPLQQDYILEDWQDDATPDQADFLPLLLELTLEGAFGDPSYGGNRDGKGWRLIGFEPCEPRHRSRG